MNEYSEIEAMDMQNKKTWLLIFAGIVLVGGIIWYMHESAAQREASKHLVLSGNVDVREVTLAFRSNDRIEELLAEEGDNVKKEQVLGRLETRSLSIQLAQVKAQVKAQESEVAKLHNGTRYEELEQAAERVRQAEASSELAQSVLARKQKVYDDVQGISEQELDSAISAANAAQAQTEAARRAYEEALTGPRAEDIAAGEAQLDALKQQQAHIEFLLSEAVLKAPADGVIRSRMHEPGDMVSPSSAIYKLSILDKKWVRVYVKESDLGRIHEGQSASVTIDSFKDKSIKGQIGYISSTAEFTPKTVQTDELRTSLLYEVRVYLDDPENILRLGMPATVRVDL
ncbi:efflux RND transporter periplasmic adaptor subunit [Schwartzia succinivorans]|jgi:HlyD family secretion protein|nr:efflux RND transporter periplasmic adaptor subunit [Schwartzia succinivorans]